jgi:arylsulfatase
VHIDGYDMTPYLSGNEEEHSRPGFLYFSDDGDVVAMRYHNWKFVLMEQEAKGTLYLWMNPFKTLRIPKIFNLRTDPFEYADITSNTFYDSILRREFLLAPAQKLVAEFLETFKEFPPRQKAPSFSLNQVLEKMQAGIRSN